VAAAFGACGADAPWDDPAWRPAEPARRIVLGSVLAAESLLDVLPRERIAGVHLFAADPGYSLVAAEAAGLPQVGAEPEQLLAVAPDLVIVDAYTRPETLALLRSACIPVVRTLDPHDFAGIRQNLERLADVAHGTDAVRPVVAQFEARLSSVRAAGRDLSPWRVLDLDGALHSYGRGSLFDAVVGAAGATNLAAEHGVGLFRQLDVEEVLAWRPDALVIAARAGEADAEGRPPAWIEQYPGLALLPCVQRGRIVRVPGPLLSTTSHRLVEAAAFVQEALRRWGSP
jgi:iron complex transport system substrate-binding protein